MRLTAKKKETTQINKREREEIITNATEIQKKIKKFYEQISANKFDNLEETDKFLETQPAKTKSRRNRQFEQTNH